jgi:hypothetical protein
LDAKVLHLANGEDPGRQGVAMEMAHKNDKHELPMNYLVKTFTIGLPMNFMVSQKAMVKCCVILRPTPGMSKSLGCTFTEQVLAGPGILIQCKGMIGISSHDFRNESHV